MVMDSWMCVYLLVVGLRRRLLFFLMMALRRRSLGREPCFAAGLFIQAKRSDKAYTTKRS